jgi:hypothetical protein
MIGTIERAHGLYILKDIKPVPCHNSLFSSNKSCNMTFVSQNLWHYRLGHISHKRLHVMDKTHPYITMNKMLFVISVVSPDRNVYLIN